ncbi:MAG TPA: hypothetical protein VHZ03_08425, partial [Trebonia sp.]|nr:hypothetical protein [Trebonia sp.]
MRSGGIRRLRGRRAGRGEQEKEPVGLARQDIEDTVEVPRDLAPDPLRYLGSAPAGPDTSSIAKRAAGPDDSGIVPATIRSARVTTLSALGARSGSLQWDDLQYQGKYQAMKAYSQSKLAEMLFALELDRRSRAAGWGIVSNTAHPGLTLTNLQTSGWNMGRDKPS